MAMEAPMRSGASYECNTSSLVLSLPQPYLPSFCRTAATTTRCSSVVHTRTSCTPIKTRNRRALPLCQCSSVSSTISPEHRLDFMLCVGSAVIPHPAKVEKGGEDAFFVSSYNGGVIGVADGVSGWAEENIDPALFSQELMEHAVAALDSDVIGNCPRQLLAKAHEATSAIGAATAIVAILEREGGVLHIANLGDCGLRVIRKGSIVFATSTQQHYFDCPYQLSSEPGAQTSIDAKVHKVEVLPGDIIIMGSDGLFDNVYDKDIEKTVSFFRDSDENFPQQIASALASLASEHAKDVKYESPYSQEAVLQGYNLPLWRRILGQKLTGGKLDDITVLTAHVVVAPALPKEEPVLSSEEDISFPPAEEETNIDSVLNELLAPAV
eukprot:c15257_g1_i1 orf=137-1282(-)